MTMPAIDHDDRLHRALNYPYDWPGACFLFRDSAAHTVDDRPARRRGRTPVVAFGSNKSPEQLTRKFGALADADAILVEACRIADHDVVHAARITSYGALPAAMVPAAGVTVTVAVTWLDDAQLVQMDASELVGVNYGRDPMGLHVELADGTQIDHAEFYATTHEPLHLDGVVVSHADIEATGRRGPAARNDELLRRAHARHAADHDFEVFLLRLSGEPDYRKDITVKLKAGL